MSALDLFPNPPDDLLSQVLDHYRIGLRERMLARHRAVLNHRALMDELEVMIRATQGSELALYDVLRMNGAELDFWMAHN